MGGEREMVKAPFYDKNGLKKGAWTPEEDDKLRSFIQRYGHSNWYKLPKLAGMKLYNIILKNRSWFSFSFLNNKKFM